MARITGPTVDDRGDYRAIEVMAHDLVRLEKVGTLPEPDRETLKIRVPRALARKIKRRHGEGLDAAICRLLQKALDVEHGPCSICAAHTVAGTTVAPNHNPLEKVVNYG